MTQTITQILLLIVSAVAVFTIVVPGLSDIGDIQAETDEYALAVESASQTNQRLNELIRQTESLSQQERYRIDRFVPYSIDPIKTAYELETLVEQNDLFLVRLNVLEESEKELPALGISANRNTSGVGFGDQSQTANAAVTYKDFELGVAGTYEQFKALLANIESSAQLFEVQSIAFQSTNSDIIQFSLAIRTYGLTSSNSVLSTRN